MDIIYNSPWLLSESVAREYLQTYEDYIATKGQVKHSMAISDSWETRVVGDTAIIPVTGVIMRYANNINTLCGTPTSTGLLHKAVKEYADDNSISRIILDIDSPGGDARGIADLAATIRATTEKKPVIAVASGMCASAAYWIASACSEIYASETSLIGSIGAVAGYRKDKDTTVEEIVSSQSPNKRLDIEKESDRAIVQSNIDDVASVFISAVGKYRGMTDEEVIKAGNKGATLIASKALKNKLIDGIGSIDTVLSKKEKLMSDKQEEIKESISAKSSETSNIDLNEIKGSIPDEMYNKIEAMVAQANANTELIKAQAEEIKAKQAEIERQSFIAKAEKEFPNLTGTADEKGSLLMALETLSPEHKQYLLGLMTKANEETGTMMETMASNVAEKEDEFDSKVEARATEIMAKHNVSKMKALSLAMRELGK